MENMCRQPERSFSWIRRVADFYGGNIVLFTRSYIRFLDSFSLIFSKEVDTYFVILSENGPCFWQSKTLNVAMLEHGSNSFMLNIISESYYKNVFLTLSVPTIYFSITIASLRLKGLMQTSPMKGRCASCYIWLHHLRSIPYVLWFIARYCT